jgi:translocation and assembly module TamB
MPRWARVALAVLIVPILLAGIALFVVTQTDYGHERVRRFAQKLLDDNTSGVVRIGRVSGDLLSTITVHDFSITDSAGRPFISVARASARYNLLALVAKRIEITRLALVRPVAVLDRRPDDDRWNWERIFPRDTTPDADTTSGFGDWIAMRNVTIDSGRVMLRMPWSPNDSLPPAQRDSVIEDAMSGGTREMIVRVPGGFQQVMDFRRIDARLPRLRLADPDSSDMVIQIAAMRSSAEPFRPPAAELRDLRGTVYIGNDSLWVRDAWAALPGSQVTLGMTYMLEPGDMRLTMRAHPATLGDLRWLYPRLPSRGTATLVFSMERSGGRIDFMTREIDAAVDGATMTGSFGMVLGDSVRFHDTDLRFARLDTRLAEQLVHGLEIPRRGTVSGRVAVSGPIQGMRVDGDVTFDAAGVGPSRIVAAGVLGMQDGAVSAGDLHVELRPVQVELARVFAPSLPIAGIVRGEATFNGSTRTRLAAVAELEHLDRGEQTRIAGDVAMSLGARRRLDLDVRLRPLSLVTAGRFAPALGLRGSASGRITLAGDLADLGLRADLRLPDGGSLVSRGRLDIASAEKAYDLTATLRVFNLGAVATALPRSSVSAVAMAQGRGLDPATMDARFAVDASASTVDSVAIDTVRVRVAIADGMATVDSMLVRAPFAQLTAHGTLGMAETRAGELTYQVAVDSLAGLARWIPGGDTGVVRARAGRYARAMARARADSIREAQATELRRMAMGGRPPRLEPDTAGLTLARDSLSGSVYTAGTMRGSIRRFDVRGRAALARVVARGNAVGSGRAEYAVVAGGTPDVALAAGATFDTVQAGGFLLDSLAVQALYRRPNGETRVQIFQDSARTYDLRAEFVLRPDERELRFTELRLRFDTTMWAATHPTSIRWGTRGIAIDTFELRSAQNGRIYANGVISTEGVSDAEVDIAGLEIGHVAALLQGDVGADGVLALTARLQGTRESPRLRGALGLVQASYRGAPIPDLRTTFTYADAELAAHAEVVHGAATPLAVLDAVLPLNLALAGYSGNRLLDRPMRVDLLSDSLPLDALPKFTDAVSNIRGRLIGRLAARGTPRNPALAGVLAVDFASFRVVPVGVTFRDIFGVVRMQGDTLVIDSLVARSDGLVRVTGGLDVSRLSRPGFALRVTAQHATVLDNEQGQLHADADILVRGPYEAIEVTGDAQILDGVVYLPEPEGRDVINAADPQIFNVIDTSLTVVDDVIPNQNPLLQNMRVDIDVGVSRDTWLRSAEANIEIFSTGDLSIQVDRGRQVVTLEGVVNTERGDYTFLARRFNLSRGSVTFIGDPEINPLLQLIGEHEVRLPGQEALMIQVIVGGTLQRPRVSLQSNAQPPLSQTDLLSYLAFGRSSSTLMQQQGSSLSGPSAGGGQIVGDVGALITRQAASQAIGVFTAEAEQEVARRYGVDVFNVTPADVPSELSIGGVEGLLRGTEIEVGKYIDRRTFVAVQLRPTGAVPGARVARRFGRTRIEASFEPRFLLREPSLAVDRDPAQPIGVFGTFLIREWRF